MNREIWTREGRVGLRPAGEIATLGGTFDERITAMIGLYAGSKPSHLQEPTREVYERAYRRAGLIPGNPDDIGTRLPPDLPSGGPSSPQSASDGVGGGADAEDGSGPAETI